MRAQPIPPTLRWGTKVVRISGKAGTGPWYADAGEPGFIIIMTLSGIAYTATLANRTTKFTISGDEKLNPGAAVASLQHRLKAIRRASG